MTESDRLFDRARRVLVGGVNSPARAFTHVGGTPRFIAEAAGARVTDAEGRTYIDCLGAWGPLIAGHAHPDVISAVRAAAARGLGFGASARPDLELAEEITARIPSAERVRLTNSGTESVMTALRLAKGITRRPLALAFRGNYHGHAESTQPAPVKSPIHHARYNDPDSAEQALAEHPDRFAAVIVEPVAGNMGVVPPEPGFLEALRELAARHGALLVFDEVITGFRVARGGAQERYRVTPDLTTLGKIVGGGLPGGAVAGPAELLDQLAPAGPIPHAGTQNGNPVVAAAGLATLRLLDDDAYARLESLGARLERGLTDAIEHAGATATVQRVGSMLSLFFTSGPVRNAEDAAAADHARFAVFFHSMLDRGVYLPPHPLESWFLSLAHTEADIDAITNAARDALATTQPA